MSSAKTSPAQTAFRDPPEVSGKGAKGSVLGLTSPKIQPAHRERLALVYIAASIRRGIWMIPAFHAAIDAGIADAHDAAVCDRVARIAVDDEVPAPRRVNRLVAVVVEDGLHRLAPDPVPAAGKRPAVAIGVRIGLAPANQPKGRLPVAQRHRLALVKYSRSRRCRFLRESIELHEPASIRAGLDLQLFLHRCFQERHDARLR